MPTLYNLAETNIKKTWILMSFFLILVIGFGYLLSYLTDNFFLLLIAVILAVFQSVLSWWYSDKIILAMTKAKPIQKDDNPQLYRIVENLSITAGLPTPKIFILKEKQPNAFATGRNPQHSAIVLTEGLLEKLEKTELEGVVAHEISHISNRDTLLATVIVILVGIVSLLSRFFFRLGFYSSSSNSQKKSGNLLFIFSILGFLLAPFVATLIQLAISRKREFLADASGVLLTRYPEGLARALEKISQDKTPLRVANESIAHLFISSPFKRKINWLTKLFLTHPPVEERIKALREMSI